MGVSMKKTHMLLSVVILMSILSGCSSSVPELPTNPDIREVTEGLPSEGQPGEESVAEDQNTVEAENAEKQILTITASSLYRDYLTSRKSMFMESHPEVDIRLTFYQAPTAISENPYVTRVATDLMGGNASDIIQIAYPILWQYGAQGYYEGLYQYLEKDEDISKESFYPDMLKAMETGGELYVLPVTINYRILVLNTDYAELLKEELEGKYTLTYYDLAELCDVVKSSLPAGTVLYPTNAYSAKYALMAEMNTFFNVEEKYVDFSGATDLIEFVEPYTVPGMNEDFPVIPDENALFMEFAYAAYGAYPALDEDNSFQGGAYLLANTKGETTFSSNIAFAINSASQNKDLAWEFLKFSTEDVQSSGDGMYITQYMPAREDEWENYTQRFSKMGRYDNTPILSDEEALQSAYERLQEFQFMLNCYDYGEAVFWDQMMPSLKDYGIGLIDAQELTERLQDKLTAYINK